MYYSIRINEDVTHLVIARNQETALRRRNNADSSLQALTANTIIRLSKHRTDNLSSHCGAKSACSVLILSQAIV